METEVLVGAIALGGPALAFVYQQLFIHASYQMHKLQKMDASATETRDVETVPNQSKN